MKKSEMKFECSGEMNGVDFRFVLHPCEYGATYFRGTLYRGDYSRDVEAYATNETGADLGVVCRVMFEAIVNDVRQELS